MEVQNFECQIAQSQMSRYLAGETFSAEAVKQLNEHVAHCVNCKGALAQRRAALQDQLSKPARQTQPAAKAVVQQQPEEVVVSVSEEQASKPTFAKPLVLSTALAVVLIGMTVISRDPTALFGQRASAATLTPPAAATSTELPRWSGSALAASMNKALKTALQKHASANQAVAPVQVPLNQIKPLETLAAKGSPIGGAIGDVAENGYPAVTVYPSTGQKPSQPTVSAKHTPPAKKATQPVSKRKSTPKPSEPRRPAIVIYDSEGNTISKQGAPNQ